MRRRLADQSTAPFGINLIGYLSGNLGLGVSARHYLRLLDESGLDVCPIEVPVTGNRAGHDVAQAQRWLPLDAEAPHRVNVFVMNPFEIVQYAARHPALSLAGKVNCALSFWELPRLPRGWAECLAAMDIAIAPSSFVKYALLADYDGGAVRDLAHPLYLPAAVKSHRSRWSIPDRAITFCCSFEMASDINRKNPFGAIDAFEAAFGDRGEAVLVVKVNNSRSETGFPPHLERLVEHARRNPYVLLVDEVLSYADVLSLYASCDVFVSLHRAEGLGLCLMEAMALGKPAVATAWSGNMDFSTERNSCLVGYRLVPVRGSTQIAYSSESIGPDARWADPDIDQAAQWMRRLAADAQLRRAIGVRAAEDMAAYQRRIDVGELTTAVGNVARRRSLDLGSSPRSPR